MDMLRKFIFLGLLVAAVARLSDRIITQTE